MKVGNAHDAAGRTGVTVVLCPEAGATAAVDVRGGAPGTRETDALNPTNLVDAAHAIVLSGGSAFGLEAAGGVQLRLASENRGFAIAGTVVPIVPAAILFDLANGGEKNWGDTPPYRNLGTSAYDSAGDIFPLGNVGAGYGAVTAGLKGGLGSASIVDDMTGVTCGAVVAVNAVGSAVMPDSNVFWAWPFEIEDEFGGFGPPRKKSPAGFYRSKLGAAVGGNTTLAIVATDATLSKTQTHRLATMAHDGLARAIHPLHTPFDGDTVFALATGTGAPVDTANLSRLGSLTADCLARAVARGVYEAETLGPYTAYKDHRQR